MLLAKSRPITSVLAMWIVPAVATGVLLFDTMPPEKSEGHVFAIARAEEAYFDQPALENRKPGLGPGKRSLRLSSEQTFYSVSFSADSRFLAAGNSRDKVYVWDVSYGKREQCVLTHAWEMRPGGGGVRMSVFSPRGRTLVVAGWDEDPLCGWDVSTAQMPGLLWRTRRTITGDNLAVSPDGKWVATAVDKIWLYELATGKCLKTWEGNNALCLAFSTDGKTLASGNGNWTVSLWDIENGEERFNIKADQFIGDGAVPIAFSPDGQILATAGRNPSIIELWDPATGKKIRRLTPGKGKPDMENVIWSVVFAPDGKSLAATDGETVRQWDVETGKELRRWNWGGQCLAISPDGKALAVGGCSGVFLFSLEGP